MPRPSVISAGGGTTSRRCADGRHAVMAWSATATCAARSRCWTAATAPGAGLVAALADGIEAGACAPDGDAAGVGVTGAGAGGGGAGERIAAGWGGAGAGTAGDDGAGGGLFARAGEGPGPGGAARRGRLLPPARAALRP